MAPRIIQRIINTLLPIQYQKINNKQKAALFMRLFIIPQIKNWQYGMPIRRIGNPSAFGSVYITDKGFAVKLQNNTNTARTEINTHRSLWGNANLKPFVPEPFKNYSVPINNLVANKMVEYKAANTKPTTGKISVIVMELFNTAEGWMSLGDYVGKYKSTATKKQKNKAISIVKQLHTVFAQSSYPHQNGHIGNIMVKVDAATGNIVDHKFIDFGSVKKMPFTGKNARLETRSGKTFAPGTRRTGENREFSKMNKVQGVNYRFNAGGTGYTKSSVFLKDANLLWN